MGSQTTETTSTATDEKSPDPSLLPTGKPGTGTGNGDTEVELPTLEVFIGEPAHGQTVKGPTFQVKGTAGGNVILDRVWVQFGNGAKQQATTGPQGWTFQGTVTVGGPLRITAYARGSYRILPGPVQWIDAVPVSITITVDYDKTPPLLTISWPPDWQAISQPDERCGSASAAVAQTSSELAPAAASPATFCMTGTASDDFSGLKTVEFRVGSTGAFKPATLLPGSSSWTAKVSIPADGWQTVAVRAIDNYANESAPVTRNVQKVVAVSPDWDPSSPLSYLRELIAFARNRVVDNANKPVPSFAAVFFQPFERLVTQEGDRLLPETDRASLLRLAVEALRRYLKPPGWYAHWRFDEGSGAVTADSSGNGHTGALLGPSWTEGRFGPGSHALSFDGVDDYVSIGAASDLVMTNALTIAAWINPTGPGGGGVFVNKEGEYQVAWFADGTLRWGLANASPGWSAWTNTGHVVPKNAWSHVVISYDGSAIRTYANGKLVHTRPGSGVIGDTAPNQNELRIGGRQNGPHNFAGRIDDVRIYDRALSASEVHTLFAETPAGEFVWAEDAVPAGATVYAAEDGWNWVSANPTPFSGGLAHQSIIAPELHQHFFTETPIGLAVNRGDRLFAYVYLDPANPPRTVMLQWDAGSSAQPGWEHRAYWGENKIPWGVDGTVSRRYMGPLPPAGQWVRLEAPARQVGLEDQVIIGTAFTLFGGRATWDRSGKVGYSEALVTAASPYRQAAYQTMLTRIGTSYEEVRLAKAADTKDPMRKALADRLGIDLSAQRPDEIDARLYMAPGQVTEAGLEALFGLRDTTRDPLSAPPTPDLLTWRRGRLGRIWREQDGPLEAPLVDPDEIGEPDLAPSATNPALGLLRNRRAWVDQRLATLASDQRPGESPLARFDRLVGAALAPTTMANLEALMGERQAGKRIDGALEKIHLTIQSFVHLMRLRNLARSGTILPEEWADLYAILVQVQKRRAFPSWRTEEANLTLSPDFFRIAPVGAPSPLRPWLGTARARRDWQDRLRARIDQDAAVAEALATAVSETETATLPLLRDTLLTSLGEAAVGLDIVGNWLTDRLMIDVRDGGFRQTTRMGQANHTLQDLLLSLRTGRLANLDTSLGQHPAASWQLTGSTDEFDRQWKGMGTFAAWRAASLAFIYPENQLMPSLRIDPDPTPAFRSYVATASFGAFLRGIRGRSRFSAMEARAAAIEYVKLAAKEPGHPIELTEDFRITDQLSPEQRDAWAKESEKWLRKYPRKDKPTEWRFAAEVFFFVPLQIAHQLQQAAQYAAALDWYRLVYAYDLPYDRQIGNRPLGKRKVYYGLVQEEEFSAEINRGTLWPADSLNPHYIASDRREAYTRATLLALVRCFLAYADAQFATDTGESIAVARGLYIDAIDLLNSRELRPATATTAFPPPNPVLQSLRRHAELNLAKIRDARNVAGMRRRVESDSALHASQDGRLDSRGAASFQPTPYRYGTLIDRAKHLAALAQQFEASYLAALEKRDDEAYNLLKAQQDLGLSRATVDVQVLREAQAAKATRIAFQQQVRSQIQAEHYAELIEEGPSFFEWATLALSINTKLGNAAISAVLGSPQSPGIHEEITGTLGSFERREQEWQFQQALARQDIIIGRRQIESANLLLDVARKEREVSQLRASHADATVTFLAGQFTGVVLYEFMATVLAEVYRYFLQQATAMARLAESQLAFERQELPPVFIQADYWEAPAESAPTTGATGNGADFRGMTGSARLVADIHRLDGYAFETNTRKLQLTKTISLAQLAPLEFQRFRETGVIAFQTPMDLYDWDFPGHLLRLIRRVRVSMLALVPTVHGIRATLTNDGVSRVTLGDTFETVTLHRDPEQVALSSATNASGLFELDAQPELLWPFEGTGIATSWELQLPKPANRIDYQTIADVLLTIEYTALNSDDYRQQVIQRLGRDQSGDRVFSVRLDFPDAWYALHNPDPSAPADAPLKLELQTLRDDFPPNLDLLKIQQLVFGVFRAPGADPFEIEVKPHLTPTGASQQGVSGDVARSVDGLISTRTSAVDKWSGFATFTPVGSWAFDLKATGTMPLSERFKKEEVEDIVFAITYSGQAPEWPA